MSENINLAITGLPHTGKSKIAEHLKDEHGFFVVSGSDEIKKAAAEQGRPLAEREDYRDVFIEVQQQKAIDWIPQLVFMSEHNRNVQDGLRGRHEASTFHILGGVIIGTARETDDLLFGIHPNDSKRPHSSIELARHIDIDSSTNEFGNHLLEAIQAADYTVNTSGMLADTYSQVDDIIAKIEAR